jgi:hypothetical protein
LEEEATTSWVTSTRALITIPITTSGARADKANGEDREGREQAINGEDKEGREDKEQATNGEDKEGKEEWEE